MNQQKSSNGSKTIWLLASIGVVAILLIVGGFVAIRHKAGNCGKIERDAKAVVLPQKFEHISDERVECNNFIEGYPDKYDQIYRLSSVSQDDLKTLESAINQQGYTTVEFPTFYQRGEHSVLAKFGEHLSSNNQIDTANVPSKDPVYLKLEWRGPH